MVKNIFEIAIFTQYRVNIILNIINIKYPEVFNNLLYVQ